MNSFRFPLLIVLCAIAAGAWGCKPDEPEPPVVPNVNVTDFTAYEGNFLTKFAFKVTLTAATTEAITVTYATEAGTALAGADFVAANGSITFAAGEISKTIDVQIVTDSIKEPDETFNLVLSNATNAVISKNIGIGTIRNDDTFELIPSDGYTTPESYPGMTLVWRDEFDGPAIDLSNWGYDIGGGGWGNNELQYYTNSSENSYINDGHLVIEAKQQNVGGRNYTSARMISKGKREFQHGRVDIRAKLPKGQGIWPALWMLGANFDQVNWPRCGEIDIMELLGQDPKTVHGTVHYANSNNAHEFRGSSNYLTTTKSYADEFHVFSLIWRQDTIRILADDKQYFQATRTSLNTSNFPFNAPFFFIMNIAVGGNWPGSPDATTTFPQQMVVDYVRVFQ